MTMFIYPRLFVGGIQAARVAAEGPILTQQAYTTLVNRLMLLLRRAEGNSRISGKLKKRAKVGIASPSKDCSAFFSTAAVRAEACGGVLSALKVDPICCLTAASKVSRDKHAFVGVVTAVLRCTLFCFTKLQHCSHIAFASCYLPP